MINGWWRGEIHQNKNKSIQNHPTFVAYTHSEVKTHSQDTADETEDSATRTPTRPTPVSNGLKIESKSINNPQTRAKKNQIKNK